MGSYSFLPCMAFVILFILLPDISRPSMTAPVTSGTVARWSQPCGGSQEVEDESQDEEDTTITMPSARDEFAELSSRATTLKLLVNRLKNAYVLSRFGDASRAEQTIDSGLVVDGAPTWNASVEETSERLKLCYENLARLAVLTRLMYEGEVANAEIQSVSFASNFTLLEDHHEGGLYDIMCRLNVIMTRIGVTPISDEKKAEVASITSADLPNNAVRHSWDYLVLCHLENSSNQLSSNFDHLVGHVFAQTTPAQQL